MHVRNGRELECVVPPSGLVTALDPVLRACDGVWIASGSGDADALTVDEFDRLRVPPDDPKYTLRRVWLSAEEESQYYDGFANEGLWPLCHIAHTRPIFRTGDWECYQRINERFAHALLAEMKDSSNPIVLVQDYHFALLPRMIKRARPDARVAIFWHIPWPNPEAFGICPWQNDLLEGLLGADLIGFHIPLHCHNFLSTVDRALEARTSHEHLTTRRHGHLTTIRAYPISVACEELRAPAFRTAGGRPAARHEQLLARDQLLSAFGVHPEYLAIGVDRLDYTKGIRRAAHGPRAVARHSRPGIATASRWCRSPRPAAPASPATPTCGSKWKKLSSALTHATRPRAGSRSSSLSGSAATKKCSRWYEAADICLVTSLHDGMNLVAKEFVAARDDEDGVLVLSRFTGAAGELPDALLVNPYDISGVAETIHRGLQMTRAERRDRMTRMRRQVIEHNIYLWAATILGDLRELRLENEELSHVAPDRPHACTRTRTFAQKDRVTHVDLLHLN